MPLSGNPTEELRDDLLEGDWIQRWNKSKKLSGCWRCLPAVEGDMWPVEEVAAMNAGQAACIILRLLLYSD